jgi:hypothetical protein
MSRFIGETAIEGGIRNLEQRVGKIERRQPSAITFGDATRTRVRIGQDPGSGKFGVWVWNAGGGLIFVQEA